MGELSDSVSDFLAQSRIAVVGVSRSGDTAGNIIYRKLRDSGYNVFAVNPNATQVEGDACFPSLAGIPGGVEAVVIATHPTATEGVVQECAALGVHRLWMHRSFGQGSVSESGARAARAYGLTLIEGGCPLMFCEPVDVAHKCMRWILGVTGNLPRSIPARQVQP